MKLEVKKNVPGGSVKPTPLLFVHGKWHAAWCWEEHFLPYFARHGYESWALSLRGHGTSEGLQALRWHSIADYVADVETIARRFDRHPVLVGHSMGGFITQKYLERHHDVPAAVLLTPIPPTGLWPTTLILLRKYPYAILKVLATRSLYPTIETLEMARWMLFSEDYPEGLLEQYHTHMQDESFRAYLDEMGLNLVRLRKVKTPLLIIGAEKDNIITPNMVRRTARAYGTRASIFPDMAHDVMLEAGWKGVAQRILEWLGEKGL